MLVLERLGSVSLGLVSFNLRVILFTWISALQGLFSPVGKALVLALGAVTLGEARLG
jgi:hypothetical protein